MTASQLIVQFCVLALVCLFPASTSALPAHSLSTFPSKRSTITTLTSTQVSSYTPYPYYAAAGYCKPNTTITWSCGLNCNATSTFIPVASGGNEDSSTPRYWYVGYDSALKEVVVGHQGTLKSNILLILEDLNIIRRTLDSSLFPGLDSSIKVHTGFADAHEKTASGVLAAVNATIAKYGVSKVTIVGHSLGAAVGLLDAIYLPLHIPNITTSVVGLGLPRVGNQAFANYVDGKSPSVSVTHINNKEDYIPILPGRILGYHHPSGEVRIQDSGVWVACSGQDNTDSACTTGAVSSILAGNISNHGGPYNGVYMGSQTCS